MHSPLLNKDGKTHSTRVLPILVSFSLFLGAALFSTTILRSHWKAAPSGEITEAKVGAWDEIGNRQCVDLRDTCLGQWFDSNRNRHPRMQINVVRDSTGYLHSRQNLWNQANRNPLVNHGRLPARVAPIAPPQQPNQQRAQPVDDGSNDPQTEVAVGSLRRVLAEINGNPEWISEDPVGSMRKLLASISPVQSNAPNVPSNLAGTGVNSPAPLPQANANNAPQPNANNAPQPNANNGPNLEEIRENAMNYLANRWHPGDPYFNNPPISNDVVRLANARRKAMNFITEERTGREMAYICNDFTVRHPQMDCTDNVFNMANYINEGGDGTVFRATFNPANHHIHARLATPNTDLVVKYPNAHEKSPSLYGEQMGMLIKEGINGIAIQQRAPGLAIKTVDVYKSAQDSMIMENEEVYKWYSAPTYFLAMQPVCNGDLSDANFVSFISQSGIKFGATYTLALLDMFDLLHIRADFVHIDVKAANILFLPKAMNYGTEIALILGDLGSARPLKRNTQLDGRRMAFDQFPGVTWETPEIENKRGSIDLEAHDIWAAMATAFTTYYDLQQVIYPGDKRNRQRGLLPNVREDLGGMMLNDYTAAEVKQNLMALGPSVTDTALLDFFVHVLAHPSRVRSRAQVPQLRVMLNNIINNPNNQLPNNLHQTYSATLGTIAGMPNAQNIALRQVILNANSLNP